MTGRFEYPFRSHYATADGVEERAHTLQRHVALMTGLIEQLGLKDVIVAGQDWGGPIGLRYAISA